MSGDTEAYYSAKELAGLVGIPGSIQGVINKAVRENWSSQTRPGKGGGKEYPLSALPKVTQEALKLQEEKGSSLDMTV